MKPSKRKTSDPSFRESMVRVAGILGHESCVLIGGLAVAAYGHERATKDVDFICRLPTADARRLLEGAGLAVEIHRGDPDEGVPTFLRTMVGGVPIDVLPTIVAVDWEHLADVPLTAEGGVKVVDLETLLLLKARARGLQDLLDMAQLVWRYPDRLPLARDLAGRYGVGAKLEACLRDRRERRKYVETLPAARRRRTADELRRLIGDEEATSF